MAFWYSGYAEGVPRFSVLCVRGSANVLPPAPSENKTFIIKDTEQAWPDIENWWDNSRTGDAKTQIFLAALLRSPRFCFPKTPSHKVVFPTRLFCPSHRCFAECHFCPLYLRWSFSSHPPSTGSPWACSSLNFSNPPNAKLPCASCMCGGRLPDGKLVSCAAADSPASTCEGTGWKTKPSHTCWWQGRALDVLKRHPWAHNKSNWKQ